MISNPRCVAIADAGDGRYPVAPFSPDWKFAEYPFTDLARNGNRIYSAVRETLKLLKLDEARYGTPGWNPLGAWIQPGSRVLVKPNLVRHFHPFGLDPTSIVTHASVLRAICDYVWIALGGEGKLVIADAPLQSCDFEAVGKLSGLDGLVDFYTSRGLKVEVRDLRLVRAVVERKSIYGKVMVQEGNPGDPLGYTPVRLSEASLHAARGVSPERYRVTCYDPGRMSQHHADREHEYIIANTLLDADCVINVPKMKTHHKAGITGALKNFIGINGHKDCLPHHVQGSAAEGGDEYLAPNRLKRIDSWLQDRKEDGGGVLVKKGVAAVHGILHGIHMRLGGASYWEGSWHGNDTISRTTVDLNRIVRFADKLGKIQNSPQRNIFTLVDGVIAGELDGPLAPTPKNAGVILAGSNPVAVDMAMTRMMGFRCSAIPTIRHAVRKHEGLALIDFQVNEIDVISADERWRGMGIERPGESLEFQPHRGWKGHIEL